MKKKFLTQKEKIFLRHLKNTGKKLTPQARENLFGKTYNPYFNYYTNQIEK